MSEPDFIASDLLAELRDSNQRKDRQILFLYKMIATLVITSLLTVGAVVGGFIWYLNKYDFTSYTTSTAEGVYAIIDSDGNVISSDLTADEIGELLPEVVDNG